MSNEVLAVVAGKEITNAELDAFLQNAPREQQAYVTNPQFRQQYLEQLISLHLFAQAGEDAKLEETEEFAKILENAKRDILAQLAMRETLKDVTVTDEEVAAYYEENKQQFTKGETVKVELPLAEIPVRCRFRRKVYFCSGVYYKWRESIRGCCKGSVYLPIWCKRRRPRRVWKGSDGQRI